MENNILNATKAINEFNEINSIKIHVPNYIEELMMFYANKFIILNNTRKLISKRRVKTHLRSNPETIKEIMNSLRTFRL